MTVKEVKLYRAYTKDEFGLYGLYLKKVDEIKLQIGEVSEIILVKNPSDVDVRISWTTYNRCFQQFV